MEWSDKEAPGYSVEDLMNAAKKDQDGVNSLYLKIDNEEYAYLPPVVKGSIERLILPAAISTYFVDE